MVLVVVFALSPSDGQAQSLRERAKVVAKERAEGMALLAEAESNQRDSVRASELATQALEAATEIRDTFVIAGAIRLYGNLCLDRGHYTEALTYFREALVGYERVYDQKKVGTVHNDLGLCYLNLGTYDSAYYNFAASLAIDRLRADTVGMVASMTNLARLVNRMGQPHQAITYLDTVAYLDSMLGDWMYYAQDLSSLSQFYIVVGDNTRAVDLATRAYILSDSLSDTPGVFQASSSLGQLYLQLDDLDAAERFLKIALRSAEELGKQYVLWSTYARLQLLAQRRDDVAAVRRWAEQSLLTATPEQAGRTEHNLGRYFDVDRGEEVEARRHYERAIALADSAGLPEQSQITYVQLGLMLGGVGEAEEGRRLFERGLAIDSEEPIKFTPRMFRRASLLYDQTGDAQQTTYYLQKAIDAQDSVLYHQRTTQQELNSFERKAAERELREWALALDGEQARRRRLTLLLLLGAVTLVAVSGLVVYIRRQNRRLKLANEQLTVLQEELNHRVRNDFQSIASMLYVNMQRADSGADRSAMGEVRERLLLLGEFQRTLQAAPDEVDTDALSLLRRGTAQLPPGVLVTERLEGMAADFLSVTAARQLLSIIAELVTNAHRHGLVGTPVQLELSRTATGGLRVSVDNMFSGGAAAGAMEADDERGREKELTVSAERELSGLGLRIVQEICRYRGWIYTTQVIDNHHRTIIDL